MAQYLEAHKADADFRALDQKVTLLLTKNKEQAGKNESIEKKIRALEKRNEELEVRLKASYATVLSLLPPFPLDLVEYTQSSDLKTANLISAAIQ